MFYFLFFTWKGNRYKKWPTDENSRNHKQIVTMNTEPANSEYKWVSKKEGETENHSPWRKKQKGCTHLKIFCAHRFPRHRWKLKIKLKKPTKNIYIGVFSVIQVCLKKQDGHPNTHTCYSQCICLHASRLRSRGGTRRIAQEFSVHIQLTQCRNFYTVTSRCFPDNSHIMPFPLYWYILQQFKHWCSQLTQNVLFTTHMQDS